MSKQRHREKQGKKYQQRNLCGCKLCGDISIGRGIASHIEHTHGVNYKYYRECFGSFTMILTEDLISPMKVQ
jgi:hypothetical protein